MKKVLLLLFCCILCFSAGCGVKQNPNAIPSEKPTPTPPQMTGTVYSFFSPPTEFGIATSNHEYYGFATDENTELVWEDTRALDSANERQSDEWSVFSCDMEVTVTYGEEVEPTNPFPNEEIICWYRAEKVVVTKVLDSYFEAPAKPVIYLYPTEPTDVSVALELDGRFTCTYPEYGNGWKVTANPDGTLTDAAGTEYNYLYWEGITAGKYDFSEGFCIAGEDTAAFLEDALSQLGLTRREANEFIVYWLPMMQENAYNIISFQREAYTDRARLSISPSPDTLIRVFMAWYPSDAPVDIPAQTLNTPERNGFCAVEWGGAQTEAP